MNDREYYQMLDWIDASESEMQLLLVSGLPGYLITYYRGKLQQLQEVRCMIAYVREGTLDKTIPPPGVIDKMIL